MKIGAVSLGWTGKPLTQAMADIVAFGGDCIEINGRPGVHAGLVLDDTSAAQVRRWAAEAGLQISAVSGYCDFAQADRAARLQEVERLLTACRAAHALEVTVVRAFAGDAKPGLTLDTAWPWLVEGLQEAARRAAPLGVRLAVENHGRLLNDGPALARLVTEIAAPNVGITLDTGNFAWAGHDAEQVRVDFEAVLPHVLSLHVKDGVWRPTGDGTGRTFEFVLAGRGQLPLAEWLATLQARGFTGAACSEYEGAGDFRAGTQASLAYLIAQRR